MELTILELVTLREVPFPGDAATMGSADHRHNIARRAIERLGSPTTTPSVILGTIDDLVARGYLERVSIGLFRRTYEGQLVLWKNVRRLQDLLSRLFV